MNIRDRVVFFVAELVLSCATKRAQARLKVLLIEASGRKPSDQLIAQAAWTREPGT